MPEHEPIIKTESHSSQWLHSLPHPALIATALGALLIIFTVFIFSRSSSPDIGTLEVWGGLGQSALDPTFYAPTESAAPAPEEPPFGSNVSPVYIQPRAQTTGDADSSDSFDMSSFLALLSGSSGQATSTSADVSQAYSFIPTGLISTTSTVKKRTAAQQALYEYGNDAGDLIRSYEDSHRTAAQALTDQLQDRYNEQKVQTVKEIGNALIELGKRLEDMTNVPSSAAGAHTALAKSYETTGAKLKLLPDAKTDQTLLSAVNEYNAAADDLTKNFVTLAQLFSISGVTFGAGDSGAAFTFTAGL